MSFTRFVLRSVLVCLVAGPALPGLATARASPAPPPAQAGCDGGAGSPAICAAAQLKALNATMRRLYRAELARTQGTIAERRLIHAQNQWRRYANADCMFSHGPRRDGGPAWTQREDDCLAAHVRRRIARLRAEADCRPGDCPPPR
ncbi:lysozyme inhibitor LprI family protein [Thiomonas delicata]|uniref:Lysozyme inhibitor LprI-like N-terminal domain-containing protein n=1 Tax=Thiomonas delicata TaxID=364030 RepID=A0A238D4V4_THIDL|nr:MULTISPECIES: lysozyme inhibitor LprI family protein [Thiomonas]SBP88326.1 exported hypothetical protein [Thiomonas delicata]